MGNYKIILYLLIISMLGGCGSIKYVPIESETKTVYRDSIVYKTDTVQIPIEREVLREVLPEVDTSYLETDLASSEAFLDRNTRKLHHTLIQKDTILKPIIKYKDRIKIMETTKIQEIPIEVTKEKRVIPSWCWWLLSLNIVGLIAILIFILVKKKF